MTTSTRTSYLEKTKARRAHRKANPLTDYSALVISKTENLGTTWGNDMAATARLLTPKALASFAHHELAKAETAEDKAVAEDLLRSLRTQFKGSR